MRANRPAQLIAGLLMLASIAYAQPDTRQSAYSSMSRQNQLMQDDLSINPAMFWLIDGQALWVKNDGAHSKSCLACHGDVSTSMKGVAANFPKLAHGRLMTLEGQINYCRTQYQKLPVFDYETQPMLSLSTLIAAQSRGMPIDIRPTKEMTPYIERGKNLYFARVGQLNLSCAQCHDDRAGQKLGGVVIPQGHPTGYPIYRIEWQTVGSLQRRLRNCMAGVRAERYAFGSEELNMLETYLMHRANGMRIESPGVRP